MQAGEIVTHNGGKAVVVAVGEQTRGQFGLIFQSITFRALDDEQAPWGIREGDEYASNCIVAQEPK